MPLSIKNHYSSLRHPQANGKMEVTNRSLLQIIKNRLEGANGVWPEELPNVIWVYRTTTRVPIGKTPFRLRFGTKSIIPMEVGLTIIWIKAYEEQRNYQELNSNLDLIDKVRDEAMKRMAKYKGAMARYYNKKAKVRRFDIGNLIFKKVSQATKDPSQRKLGPTWQGPYEVICHFRERSYFLKILDGQELPYPWKIEHLKRYYH